MSDKANQDRNSSLSAGLAVTGHGALALVLLGICYSLLPVAYRILGNYDGALPMPARILLSSARMWRHPVVSEIVAVILLYVDCRIHLNLHRSKGPLAAFKWAVGVTALLLLAILWYGLLTIWLIDWMIPWRLKG